MFSYWNFSPFVDVLHEEPSIFPCKRTSKAKTPDPDTKIPNPGTNELVLLIPGAPKEKVSVQIEQREYKSILKVVAEAAHHTYRYSYSIPKTDPSQCTAVVKDGVLTVTLAPSLTQKSVSEIPVS